MYTCMYIRLYACIIASMMHTAPFKNLKTYQASKTSIKSWCFKWHWWSSLHNRLKGQQHWNSHAAFWKHGMGNKKIRLSYQWHAKVSTPLFAFSCMDLYILEALFLLASTTGTYMNDCFLANNTSFIKDKPSFIKD